MSNSAVWQPELSCVSSSAFFYELFFRFAVYNFNCLDFFISTQTIMGRPFEKCFRVLNSFRKTILVIRITFVSARPPSYKTFLFYFFKSLIWRTKRAATSEGRHCRRNVKTKRHRFRCMPPKRCGIIWFSPCILICFMLGICRVWNNLFSLRISEYAYRGILGQICSTWNISVLFWLVFCFLPTMSCFSR